MMAIDADDSDGDSDDNRYKLSHATCEIPMPCGISPNISLLLFSVTFH